MRTLDLTIDVTEAAALGEPAGIALTVHLPRATPLAARPIVCFAKPGGGYSKGYFTNELPGPAKGAQAEWHSDRGWIFVSVDHLGVGSSSTHHDLSRLDFTTLAAATQAAEAEVIARLEAGTLASDFPAVTEPIKLGLGQSMGGCMTVIQQGRYHWYDGIAVLGFSAVHSHPPVRPGEEPIVTPWLVRDSLLRKPLVKVNRPQLEAAAARRAAGAAGGAPDVPQQSNGQRMAWGFFYDDIDPAVVEGEMRDFPTRRGHLPAWASATLPGAVAAAGLSPGAVAPEAAAVQVPVLIAVGERDVLPDPNGEPRAYRSARSVDLYICPRMGHMHNFAGTRELFWRRIEHFANWARDVPNTRL